MFLVGYPQTPEPLIPPGRLAQIDHLVLTCRKTPINQSIVAACMVAESPFIMLSMAWECVNIP